MDPLPADPLAWALAADLIATDPLWITLAPQLPAWIDQAKAGGSKARRAVDRALSQAGSTGSPGNPNQFDPEEGRSVVNAIQKVMKQYPLESGNCSKAAGKIYESLSGAGYKADIVRFEYGENVAARYMYLNDGTLVSWTRSPSSRAFHEFVRVGNRVFDAITGPDGMLWEDYLKRWDPDTLKLVTEIVAKGGN